MNKLSLPSDLISVIGNEKIDFSIYAKRSQPIRKSIGTIVISLVWSIVPVIGSIVFFGPLFKGKEVHFKVNGQATTASMENFEPMLVPSLILGLFLLIGIAIFISGVLSFFNNGGYYVGTNSRLINYKGGNINYYDWEQFTGNIELNNPKGDILLELRKGKMVSRKNEPDRFVPEILYISGVTTILEIEKLCRQRIKENDPTPANIN